MSDIVKILPYSIDLDQTIEKTELHTLFVMDDKKAHRFEIEIRHGSTPASLTGCTVTGFFTNFKENTTIQVDGKSENGKAVVTLSDTCYTLHGQFVLTIQISKDGADTTVFFGEGYMRTSKAEKIVYDDYVIYDINTLLTQIAAMKKATEDTQAATTAATTAAQNATKAAGTATTAAGNADTKAQAAQAAADAANRAAQNWDASLAADAQKLGGQLPGYYAKQETVNQLSQQIVAENLAINSDFTRFVAQAGIGGMHGMQAYGGDCWILTNGTITGVANADGDGYSNITLNGTLVQVVPDPYPAVATVFVEMVSGTATISYNAAKGEIVLTSAGGVIKNVQLLEGQRAEKPKYATKGYASELLECFRRYFPLTTTLSYMFGGTSTGSKLYAAVITPTEMRVKPAAINENASFRIRTISGLVDTTAASVYNMHKNSVILSFESEETVTKNTPINAFLNEGVFALSADLPRR